MQTKTFSKISTAVILGISIYILFVIAQKVASVEPFPNLDQTASSTDSLATTTSGLSEKLPELDIKTPSRTVHALVASDETSESKGLGDRTSLAPDAGMLFVFPNDGVYGFWMKDMHFSLDMVWIDSAKTVQGITQSISPETYPNSFFPPAPIRYVLELNSGSAEKLGIATGTKLVF